jgi:4-hydroxybenzoate polyprenyltransferase
MRKLPPQTIGVVFWTAMAIALAILAGRHFHTIACAALALGCLIVSAMLVNDIRHNRR